MADPRWPRPILHRSGGSNNNNNCNIILQTVSLDKDAYSAIGICSASCLPNSRLPLPPAATRQSAAASFQIDSPDNKDEGRSDITTASEQGADARRLASRGSPSSRHHRRRSKARTSKNEKVAVQDGANSVGANLNGASASANAGIDTGTRTGTAGTVVAAADDGEVRGIADGGLRVAPLVKVVGDTPSAAAASALSHALGMEQRAVVRFDGGAGALKGLRTLTLANMFMGGYQRGLSFVVDVRQVEYGKPSPLDERPQSGDVSFVYRVMARARSQGTCDKELTAAMRRTRFLLDLSINVRQAWDMKGDVDEEQAYDLADTLYGALLAQQAEEDSELLLRQQQQELEEDDDEDEGTAAEQARLGHQDYASSLHLDRTLFPADDAMEERFSGRGRHHHHHQQQQQPPLPPPWIIVTADLGQGPTMLTALGLLQKRLREERQKAVAEATLYRASVAAPRLNGRDGWVFVIKLGFETPYLPPYSRPAADVTRQKATERKFSSPPPTASSSSSSWSPSIASTAPLVREKEDRQEKGEWRQRQRQRREPSGRAGGQGTTATAAAATANAKSAIAKDAGVSVTATGGS
ncbi:hypothetical protein VOLCADRAFT_97842 [Volvox carteri f. nagariensis]|uniref:Uncharacterized protein n=1 Tax=Volvox carteri f. nagariensis TaxID=3068 RepID=D8UDS6_VOLCA|nr:uncharacterized protein VOLCADRAFT_97842 [Volvox carteri f. nagariensis]EFJ42094.1 hypothetical protein VOLCADRAFT_97842 [Volvox carteri f. nagariensis]|eukprot:XP_002956791.1 hypothetical protein VOLCADRAFT_97842 [Volvox carteri f. nagariensis]